MKIERRIFKAEVRKAGDSRTIRGTAVVFNQRSQNLGGYVEQIEPGAFDGCDMADVRCLFNHSDDMVLGRTVSNTLKINRDLNGVQFECDPPETSFARDLAVSMERGDIDQCSFSFTVPPGGAEWSEDSGTSVRTVKRIARLYDVSVVTFPAYPQTSSQIRSHVDILAERQAVPSTASNGRATDALRRNMEISELI